MNQKNNSVLNIVVATLRDHHRDLRSVTLEEAKVLTLQIAARQNALSVCAETSAMRVPLDVNGRTVFCL